MSDEDSYLYNLNNNCKYKNQSERWTILDIKSNNHRIWCVNSDGYDYLLCVSCKNTLKELQIDQNISNLATYLLNKYSKDREHLGKNFIYEENYFNQCNIFRDH